MPVSRYVHVRYLVLLVYPSEDMVLFLATEFSGCISTTTECFISIIFYFVELRISCILLQYVSVMFVFNSQMKICNIAKFDDLFV